MKRILTKRAVARRRWLAMKSRCYKPSDKQYGDYGARGITVCNRWLTSFDNYYADMADPPTDKHSIDRVDNDGPYSPENCRWATKKEQNRNTRANRLVEYKGKVLCLMEWQEQTGIYWNTIGYRLNVGWSVEDALTISARKKQPNLPLITWNGITRTVAEWSIILGGSERALSGRLISGWPLDKAMTQPFSNQCRKSLTRSRRERMPDHR